MTASLLQIASLATWLAILAAIFVPLEHFLAQDRRRGRPQLAADLAWYFINSLVPAFIVSLPLAGLARLVQFHDPLGTAAIVGGWPVAARLAAALLVNDFGAYWMHRWQHHQPWLWRLHAVHHSAERLDWLVNTRAHPLDMVLIRTAGLVPVYCLGLASARTGGLDPIVFAVGAVGTIWSFFIHANVRLRLGPLEWLLSSPAFHHWHHSNGAVRDRNFAAIFPVIDRIFGSHHLPPTMPERYGVDMVVAPNLVGQLVDPLRLPRGRA